MLHKFKLKLLGVIVVITVVALIMQAGQVSRQVVEPVLNFIMNNKYDVGAVISRYVYIPGSSHLADSLPVTANTVLKPPCDNWEVERGYGWYWDQQERKTKFSSGMHLKVKEGTMVKTIAAGQLDDITWADGQATVLLRHNGEFYSLYGGLANLQAEQGNILAAGESLGTTATSLYFEVRGKDGPVNPHSIFK